jgi:hypothetical protein
MDHFGKHFFSDITLANRMNNKKGYEFLCPQRVVGETFVTKGKNMHA